MRMSAPECSRAAVGHLGPSAARVPGARAVAKPPLGTPTPSLFSLQKQTKQKDFQTCLGERSDAQRTSPLLSLLLSELPCGLGRISPEAHPHRSSRLGGGARSAGVPRGVREPTELGAESMQSGEAGLWVCCYCGVVEAFWGEGRTEWAGCLCFAEGVWDLVPPTRRGSC